MIITSPRSEKDFLSITKNVNNNHEQFILVAIMPKIML